MALVNLRELLAHAKANRYAVGAFNVTKMDMIDPILDAAIEEKSPVILMFAEVHLKYMDLEKLASVMTNAASEVPIPVCIHLDHGDDMKMIMRAIRAGFTSVMLDGSKYDFNKNVEVMKKVVELAHSVDVTVEGEIGKVGGSEGGTGGAMEAEEEFYTTVEEAVTFTRETNVDALAIAFGTVHGFYKSEPKLDFDRLSQIAAAVSVPLVMHGGSGISFEDFRESVRRGICKINFYTTNQVAAMDRIKQILKEKPEFNNYPQLINEAMAAVKEVVKQHIRVFGCTNRCDATSSLCQICSRQGCQIGAMYRPALPESKVVSATIIPGPQISLSSVRTVSNPETEELRKKIEEITRKILNQIK
ncbi:MAG: class II fructose-bisphosphate aldolase [Actinobacteria bacterium]|nr:class II fructose-bisphosphate aldolase [Actinomycetota bacterium]